jgi:hypothetical protein
MMYVYLTKSIVTDVSRVDPFNVFSASYAAQFVPAPDNVTHGWSWNGGNWTPPSAPRIRPASSARKAS